jgi:WD40 repeat protein
MKPTLLTTISFLFSFLCVAQNPQQNPRLIIQRGNTLNIASIGLSANDSWLVSVGEVGEMLLWDVQTGRQVRTFSGHRQGIHTVNFANSHSTKFITGGWDSLAFVWDIYQEKPIATFQKHKAVVTSVALNKEATLAVSGDFNKMVYWWDANTGKEKASFALEFPLATIKISPDDAWVVAGTVNGKVIVWNAITQKIQWELQATQVGIQCFNFYQNKLYISSMDGSVVSLDLATGTQTQESFHNGMILINTSHDGRWGLTTGGYNFFDNSASYQIIDFQSKKPTQILNILGTAPCAISHDASFVATLVIDGFKPVVHLYDTQTSRLIYALKQYAIQLSDMTFNKEQSSIWFVGKDSYAKKLNLSNNELTTSEFVADGEYVSVAVHPNGKWIATSGISQSREGQFVFFFDAHNGKFVSKVPIPANMINKVIFNPVNTHYAVVGDGANVFTFDLASQYFEPKLVNNDKDRASFLGSITYSPDGSLLVSAEQFGSIKFYAVNEGYAFKNAIQTPMQVQNIIFSPNGKYFAVCGFEKVIIWETTTWTKIQEYSSKDRWNSLAFSSDNKSLFLGSLFGSLAQMDVSSGIIQKQIQAHENIIMQILPSTDGKNLFTISHDNSLKTWSLPDFQLKTTHAFIRGSGNDFLAFTPEGYYMSTKIGAKAAHYVLDNQVYLFDQFDIYYNRPDLLLQKQGFTPPDMLEVYQRAANKRLKMMGVTNNSQNHFFAFDNPKIKWSVQKSLFENVTQKNYVLTFEPELGSLPFERIRITVNGVPISLPNNGKVNFGAQKIEIELSQGNNLIEVSAFNQKGSESLKLKKEVFYQANPLVKPNLYLIALSASQYADKQYNLKYAVKDARDWTTTFAGKKELFGKIYIDTLFDKNYNVQNVEQLTQKLSKATVDDYVLVLATGHGLLDNQGNYFLATYSTNFDNPAENGLLYQKLNDILLNTKARQKVLFIDACHSGEVEENPSALQNNPIGNDGYIVAPPNSRGSKLRVRAEESIGLQNSFAMMKLLFADLRENAGLNVISAAAGTEFALEGEEWKNGVFTYSMLSGLKNNLADANKDGQITVSELQSYLQRRVPELTQGRQNPTSRSENVVNDFRVWWSI